MLNSVLMLMLDKVLRQSAATVLSAAPCSIEMPAGAGKTHLLAASAAVVAGEGKRALILTHTNAGVDALTKRLRKFGISSSSVHIETITGWAFAMVRAYPEIAEMVVPETPDWSDSKSYIDGATRVANSAVMRQVHSASFDYFFVDEYQDCNESHHALVNSIAVALPRTIVFGDRLQGIFGFKEPLVDWETHVQETFPALHLEHLPQRWRGHNEPLGQWLLDLRPRLVDGGAFDVTIHAVPGLTWIPDADGALQTAAFGFTDFDETVLLVDKWSSDAAINASRLGGGYVMIEDIAGRFMREQLSTLPLEGSIDLALWAARFVKACVVGLGTIDATILNRLAAGESITHYSRPGLTDVLNALDSLRIDPTYSNLIDVAQTIRAVPGVKVYRWEAWNDTLESIELCKSDGQPALEHLGRIRDRLRRSGRRHNARISSTTLLVKGLEYDHVIIRNLSKFVDPRHLYVALSRARKSVVIIGSSPTISLRLGG